VKVEIWQVIVGRYSAGSDFAVTVRGRCQIGRTMGTVRTMHHSEGHESYGDAWRAAQDFIAEIGMVPAFAETCPA